MTTKHKPAPIIVLTGRQLRDALELIAPDGNEEQLQAEVGITWSDDGHSGRGFYCWDMEYPEHGSILLGDEKAQEGEE